MTEGYQQQLLEALLASGSGVNDQPNMTELLAQMGEADPRMKLIAQYLAQQQVSDGDYDVDLEDDEWHVAETESEARTTPESFRRLQRMVESMYAELEELRERNDMLAAALGACYLCWGDDVECEVCHGRGRPGSAAPDRELFAQIVLPAGRRLKGKHRSPPATIPDQDPAKRRKDPGERRVRAT